jgi:hypothetical protein
LPLVRLRVRAARATDGLVPVAPRLAGLVAAIDDLVAVALLALGDSPAPLARRSSFAAMMKSFSCSPLIFLVRSEAVA